MFLWGEVTFSSVPSECPQLLFVSCRCIDPVINLGEMIIDGLRIQGGLNETRAGHILMKSSPDNNHHSVADTSSSSWDLWTHQHEKHTIWGIDIWFFPFFLILVIFTLFLMLRVLRKGCCSPNNNYNTYVVLQ